MNQIRRVFNLLEQRLKGDNKNEKILERLDQYRAIEINNLWQRSVFLGTFLVLGYTGYGVLINNMILGSFKVDNLNLPHFLACALVCVNMIFSVLWIAMAKGSKAWYEAYENAITFVENAEKELNWKEVRSKINTIRYRFYNIKRTDKKHKRHLDDKKNDCFFSTKAGGYSPAKINIALGQISFVIWIIALLIHFLIVCRRLDFLKIICNYWIVIALIFILLLVVVIIRMIFSKWIKSSYFQD